MISVLASGPDAEPVTLAELRAHLHIDTQNDLLLNSLISSARLFIEAETGVRMLSQRWRLLLNEWPHKIIELPVWPIIEVLHVKLLGSPSKLVNDAAYELESAARPAVLMVDDAALPTPLRDRYGIELEVLAGFGTSSDNLPEDLKLSVMLLAAYWFDLDDWSPYRTAPTVPPHVQDMINRHRLARI